MSNLFLFAIICHITKSLHSSLCSKLLFNTTLKSVPETDQYKGMRVKLLKETVEASDGVQTHD